MSETTYRVLVHRDATKEIRALPKRIRERVKRLIDLLAETPVPVGVARLKGTTNAYRARVGDYRVVYEVHVTEIVVFVVGVAHRKEVYQRILRRR